MYLFLHTKCLKYYQYFVLSAQTTDDDFPLLKMSQLKEKDHLLSEQLSRDNYREKFHHLLYWEEHEHETVLKDR